jgi:uncharacterized protein (TIGR03382 family)
VTSVSHSVGLIATLVLVALYARGRRRREPRIKLPIVLVAFTAAILWIYVSANEIVALLSTLGVVFDVSGAVLVSAIARACAPCR